MQETNREMQNGKSATTNKNIEARNLKHETGMLEYNIWNTKSETSETVHTKPTKQNPSV